ncbi:hypothetical protein KOAAANKH_00644 [Brevundimonas sp. NIBR10]|uniref:hypothetical protein n=1 Tax=Brevundimonas sp. NIBR10 TaxID=3015997 RepID=UPI0022F1976F|nr:hypothetical protein [Brevundimonas sp. NIBR10]WGM45780.1 hypothetical protein KOAAANKH_00644 [Brevundimonas sp. NIBR10]
MIEILMAASLASQSVEEIQQAPRLAGVVGVCARWESDSLRVVEVIVVRPSGNATLDAAVPPTVKATAWPKPAGDTGGWTGRWVAIGGVPIPPGPQPDCSALPPPRPAT